MASHRRSKSPLSEQEKELAQQQAELEKKMEDLQKLIADAPQRAEAAKKRQRDELVARASEGGHRLDTPASLRGDDLFGEPQQRGSRPSLKAERRAMQLRFLVLAIVFIGLFILLVSKFN